MTPHDPVPVFAFLADTRLFAAVLVLAVLTFAAGVVGGVLFLFRERPRVRGVDRIDQECVEAR
jgi:hypothetical protein